MKRTSLLLLCCALFGCATAGKEISQEQIQQFKQGETSKEQVIQVLGTPNHSATDSDGRTTLVYSYAKVKLNAATFIPVVGLFAGGAETKSSAVVFRFDKTGVLTETAQSQTNTSTSGATSTSTTETK